MNSIPKDACDVEVDDVIQWRHDLWTVTDTLQIGTLFRLELVNDGDTIYLLRQDHEQVHVIVE